MSATNQKSANIERLEKYYEGETVSSYERRRHLNPSWQAESAAFRSFLDRIKLPPGSNVLDVPIGTGRFLQEFQSRGFRVVGRDISADMVSAALDRAKSLGITDADIRVGDATSLEFESRSIVLVVSVRFLVHLELSEVDKAMKEFARVASDFLVVHLRVASPGLVNALKRDVNSFFRKVRSRLNPQHVKVESKAATMHRSAEILRIFNALDLDVLGEVVTAKERKGYSSRMFLLKVRA